jgi:hypothetical protein
MLEVLPDDKLPRFGPGRADDGNFVLSEIELRWGADTNAPNTMVKFVDARADFSQQDYPVKNSIDGKAEGGQSGWAVAGAPAGSHRHTATYKLETPLTSTNSAKLRVTMKQQFAPEFQIGRFRLYVTTSDDPLDFGLPEPVVNAVRSPAGERTPEQAAAIVDYYRYTDTEFWKRKKAVVDASAPLAADPKLTDLQRALSTAETPLRLDPYLVQLREDAKTSARQKDNPRLTVVQDLAWALINSPGFLFNH